MKCHVCGRDNGNGVKFCEGCGRKIPRCPTCGLELTCRDRFCSNDGTRLSDDLLLLVPEESALQEPVWSKPAESAAPAAPVWTAPAFQETQEETVKAARETIPSSADLEETVRVTPTSGGRRVNAAPPVRNNDPVNLSDWDKPAPAPQPPKRSYCECCGKRIAAGNRFCLDCQKEQNARSRDSERKGNGKGKLIAILILAILLILGLTAGGYALVNSELFDWDTSSSNRADKEKEDADEDEEEEEETDAGENAPEVTLPDDAQGVEDPVATQSPIGETTAPIETTEATTAATEPPTEAVSNPLMYWIDNCDKKYLTIDDLAGFDKQSCVYARNAIYAKSGRMFNSTELQGYFAQFDWYTPTVSPDKFNNNMFNAYQNANLQLILEYERTHGYS